MKLMKHSRLFCYLTAGVVGTLSFLWFEDFTYPRFSGTSPFHEMHYEFNGYVFATQDNGMQIIAVTVFAAISLFLVSLVLGYKKRRSAGIITFLSSIFLIAVVYSTLFYTFHISPHSPFQAEYQPPPTFLISDASENIDNGTRTDPLVTLTYMGGGWGQIRYNIIELSFFITIYENGTHGNWTEIQSSSNETYNSSSVMLSNNNHTDLYWDRGENVTLFEPVPDWIIAGGYIGVKIIYDYRGLIYQSDAIYVS